MNIKLFLEILCGVFWILAYILIIAKSFKDKTYGMPFFAISLNLAWEFIFSFIYPPENFLIARIIFLIWLILDLIILYTNLVKLGIDKYKAYQYSNTRKGYWRISSSPILSKTLTNKYLENRSISQIYSKVHRT